MHTPFHLALPCNSITNTRKFYIETLGAKEGRNSNKWLDINLFGHQLTFTKAGNFDFNFKSYKLNDQILPSFHFGVIVDIDTWGKAYANLLAKDFEITTKSTFLENKTGEHVSFFVTDPNGYKVEFKSFKIAEEIFKTNK